jgi:hypothetical protein
LLRSISAGGEEAASAQEQEQGSGGAGDLKRMPPSPYHSNVFITTTDT